MPKSLSDAEARKVAEQATKTVLDAASAASEATGLSVSGFFRAVAADRNALMHDVAANASTGASQKRMTQ